MSSQSTSQSSSSEFLPETRDSSFQASDEAPSPSPSQQSVEVRPRLPIAQVGLINKKAQINGIFIGLPSGILFYTLLSRFCRPSTCTFTALVGGSATAYLYSRKTLTRDLTSLERSIQILDQQNRAKFNRSEADQLDIRASNEIRFEAGVGGMDEFRDNYATTRGDH